MDFFFHSHSIAAEVSVEFVDDDESKLTFFDRVNVGSEDLRALSPGPLSDLAVTVTPESVHPAFPPTGLTCWVALRDDKARQETLIQLRVYNLIPFCSAGVP